MRSNSALDALRHHVSGAIERGEAEPIIEERCPSNEPDLYVPPGHYTPDMLKREARDAAKRHSDDNGGGRPVDIAWEIAPTAGGISLIVSYYCNRPNGHVGRYLTNVAL